MGWVQTFSGRRFDLLDPKPEQLRMSDIAYSLSMQCRYNGHVTKFYSVAEHSVHVADYIAHSPAGGDAKAIRTALLHDATEAYIGDIVQPLKRLLPNIKEIEDRIWRVIAERYDCYEEIPESVRKADIRMLATEVPQVVGPMVEDWGLPEKPIEGWVIPCWKPDTAALAFLNHWKTHQGRGDPT